MAFGLKKGELPIGIYIAPTPKLFEGDTDLITDEVFADIAACGVNFIDSLSFSYDRFPEAFLLQLDLAEKHGISVLVNDEVLLKPTYTQAELVAAISRFAEKKAFAGVHGKDEPIKSQFADLKSRKDIFLAAYPDKEFYMNFLPNYASKELLTKGLEGVTDYTYEQYLDDVLTDLEPPYFCYDYYPFVGNFPHCMDGYFENLAIVAKKTGEKGIPFLCCIQATSWNPDYIRYVTNAEMSFLINTTLCFGGKGIVYFTYAVPVSALPEGESYTEALIDVRGNRTERWYFAKENNGYIKAMQETLLESNFHGVLSVGTTAAPIPAFCQVENFRELMKAEGKHLLIGCMDCKGKTTLFVMNNSIEEEEVYRLHFQEEVTASRVYRGEKSEVQGTVLEGGLAAGEAILVQIQ